MRDILSVLHSILNYAAKQQNPLAKPVDIVYLRQDRKEMRVLTCEEQKRFTEYLLQDMDPCKFGGFAGIVDRIADWRSMCSEMGRYFSGK